MAALDYLVRGGYDVVAAVYDHGTGLHAIAEPVIAEYCSAHRVPLILGGPAALVTSKGLSPEDAWRRARYAWLQELSLERDRTVVLAHHLDDVAETWLAGACHGQPKLIPWTRPFCVRPFLQTRKEGFRKWCLHYDVKYIHDEANDDQRYERSRIRHIVMPAALIINPGLHKTLAKKLDKKLKEALTELGK
jgi:tRNA(Ile)-lysidine synthase